MKHEPEMHFICKWCGTDFGFLQPLSVIKIMDKKCKAKWGTDE